MYEHISRTLRVTPRAAASPPPCILGALLRKAPRMQGGGQQPPGGERYFVTIGDIPTGSPHRCRCLCSSPSLRSGRLACDTPLRQIGVSALPLRHSLLSWLRGRVWGSVPSLRYGTPPHTLTGDTPTDSAP